LQALTTRAAKAGDTVVYDDGSDPAKAAALAKTADVAIVDIGYTESEGVDQPNLGYNNGVCELTCVTKPSDADALTQAVAAANKRTVVVLNTGGPAAMPWLAKVSSVLEAWYPGEEDGNAVAALLFGDVDPSGKLPITFPRSLSQLPAHTAKQYPGVNGVATYSEGLLVGYRWYDAKHLRPLFPFGFGLSYTTFHASKLRVRAAHGSVRVSYRITNTGARTGSAVEQVYVGDPRSSREPPHQLRNYRRTTLAPGHSTRVTLTLSAHAFAHWSTPARAWRVSPGCYSIRVGDSSRHTPLLATIARAGGHCTR
jgi:beta-glucosidase